MFTGLIEETGKFVSLQEHGDAWQLTIAAKLVLDDLQIGDSLACNGCCLTVTSLHSANISFDVLEETLRLTNLDKLQEGTPINLERSLAVGKRMGGHFVTGHVDATGKILKIQKQGKNVIIEIQAPEDFRQYLVYKGCICVDGISLTVADVNNDKFSLWLIPHTIEATNLRHKKNGDPVNLEFDLLAKYVEKSFSMAEKS